MKRMSKLVGIIVALCATVPLMGLTIDGHPASKKAQEQLAAQMLDYLHRGKDVETAFKDIPLCSSLKKVYKENQIPAKCRYKDADDLWVHTITIESVSQPGFFKQEVPVTTVNPNCAFRKAAETYFAAAKNPKYLDYNKMSEFYAQHKDTWAGNQLRRWAFIAISGYSGAAEERTIAMAALLAKTIVPTEAPVTREIRADRLGVDDVIARRAPIEVSWARAVERQMHRKSGEMAQWQQDIAEVYDNDEATLQLIKWYLFRSVLVGVHPFGHYETAWLCSPRFWESFAVRPPAGIARPPLSAEAVQVQEIEAIQKKIQEEYKQCKKFGDKYNCEEMRNEAQKYGYWKVENENMGILRGIKGRLKRSRR